MKNTTKNKVVAVLGMGFLTAGILAGCSEASDSTSSSSSDQSKQEQKVEKTEVEKKPEASSTTIESTNGSNESNSTSTETSEKSNEWLSQKNAVKSAKNYLNTMSFSRDGLIQQLKQGDGYTTEQATYAVDKVGL